MSKNPKSENAVINLKKALDRLTKFLALPVMNDRDQAGIIQAFEFNFEVFWKAFQKIGAERGLSSNSPRDAIKVAFQLKFILDQEEETWLAMIRDRNLTSHTYKEDLAQSIYERVRNQYFDAFVKALERIEKT